MIETLRMYMQYDMVRNALIVGVLIALCSSLLGVTLVLKRFSYIGDGLSHVAFGAIAIAAVLHLSDDMVLVMPVTILCAVLLLRTGQKTPDPRRRGDRHDLRRRAGGRIPADEYLFRLLQPVRRRMLDAVRLRVHPDADEGRGVAEHYPVRCCSGYFPAVLQPDFRGDL